MHQQFKIKIEMNYNWLDINLPIHSFQMHLTLPIAHERMHCIMLDAHKVHKIKSHAWESDHLMEIDY